MLKSKQIKAARALLGWSQQKLADSSGVSIASIRRIECQMNYPKAHTDTLVKIENGFFHAGITFTNDASGEGVAIKRENSKGIT